MHTAGLLAQLLQTCAELTLQPFGSTCYRKQSMSPMMATGSCRVLPAKISHGIKCNSFVVGAPTYAQLFSTCASSKACKKATPVGNTFVRVVVVTQTGMLQPGGGGLLGHSRRLSLTPSTRNLLVFLQRSRAAPELCGRVMAMAMAHSPRHIDVGYSETLYEFL